MKTTLLVISVVLTIISVIPYIRDILRGSTKPNLVSWITWTLLTGIATAAAISAEEYVAAIFTGAATFATSLIVFMGIRHGYVRYGRFDVTCQVAAVVGIIIWQIFNSPALGVVAAVTIDFVGALPTLVHIWRKPHEETWATFALSSLGGMAAFAALTSYNWVTLPYAVYIIVINTAFTVLIISRRRIPQSAS